MSVRCLKSLILAFSCLVFVVGCSRTVSSSHSKIRIQAPAASAKAGALSTLPANRKACWGANITGLGVNGVDGTTCSPATGVVAGYKLSGEEISAQVSKGSNRKIDLYVYLMPENDNGNCPVMTSSFAQAQLKDIYLVGTTTADFVADTTEVDISAVFPGLVNNVAVSNAMPATCTAVSVKTKPTDFEISAGAKFAIEQGQTAATGYKVIGRVGSSAIGKVLTAPSGHTILMKDQR